MVSFGSRVLALTPQRDVTKLRPSGFGSVLPSFLQPTVMQALRSSRLQATRPARPLGYCFPSLPSVLAGIALCISGIAIAHDAPSPAQLAEARRRGDLEERLAFMKALGNDKMSDELAERAKVKLIQAGMQASGMTRAQSQAFAPPPAMRGLPTTGSPKVLTLLIDFQDMRAPAVPTPGISRRTCTGPGTVTAQSFLPFESMNRYLLPGFRRATQPPRQRPRMVTISRTHARVTSRRRMRPIPSRTNRSSTW